MNFIPNYNQFIEMFGLNPDQFEDRPSAVETEDVFDVFTIHHVWLKQRADRRKCPHCKCETPIVVKGHYDTCREVQQGGAVTQMLHITMTRFKCKACGKSFTIPLTGIAPYAKLTSQTVDSIILDCCQLLSFSAVARRYHISDSEVASLFDDWFKRVPGRLPPRIMCIDEIKVRTDKAKLKSPYVCVTYDWERREIVEIYPSRRLPHLREEFGKIPEKDRKRVKYFVSDMYDGYATARREFFPDSIHIIDLFHVVKLLTEAVTKLRAHAMSTHDKGTAEYAFMKKHWRLFLTPMRKVPDKLFEHRGDGVCEPYADMIIRCCHLSAPLWDAYAALQELLTYNLYPDFASALSFVERIVARLLASESSLLNTVGRTYRHWANEIANGMALSQTHGKRFSNAVAEGMNNKLSSLRKISMGLSNFERFRKRALLIFDYYPKLGTMILKGKWK